ncbi:MAG TPA: bifunctional (p)ppGpp synthetase/guanosine-3',5'-bis(diphosphate) 3'-pyrophosphohydrolase [Flexilinea sp.]|jgi:GTP pyrophosphokinase|nr:bifunctional (p)ppGpp synthetase/guanosine-3',5'-bis(diphosphate) 3'-pyrophosphohydrolase [Flexilinea sp.]HOG22302.1 bifunctional (p)ppGpp synthetase/guanosine-3',5'-bis(diphosphate) 3'-pyrophosphohydrolase [Flexilinea sp.]HOR56861.1 bifunctional (p)ppGpp synthetase/guanosine-3',5'-bis(diphosphate) 3'-pyrophosphohydrolase [Flexilinea sp.]HOU20425.1 bifunctional (p)ppGpp synthetase/guanosine-3',5'-bis(diphosphate) 3'-pyrophosphohydrolase [Flexilinea sp.]HPB40635.1 bifunctional (p)ppGpp synthe
MLLDDLLAGLPDNYTQADKDLVEKAYYFAEKAHEGQKRASGEPYFTHCVAVAMILSELKVQSAAIAAGLLHDTVEDTNVTLEDIRANFGDEIAKLVDGVTKLTNIPKTNDYEKNFSPQNKIDNDPISVTDEIELGIQDSAAMRDRKRQLKNETLRKTFIAMVDDVRVIIIKLADRLHNMRTLSHVSKEKQKRIAQETLDIYAPLANRLGIWRIKWELEDLAFRYVHPAEYAQIAENLATTHAIREKEIEEIIERLKTVMESVKIDCEITGRPKHIYSIYTKMIDRNKPLEMLRDLRGVRLIVKDIPSCYAALGQIHTHWRPIPGEFDDYIAVPKDNFYQSLHTAVYYDDGKPLEVQIRTPEMHQNAEYGIAAHWRYKEHTKADPAFEKRLDWLRQLMDWRKDVEDAGEFVEGMKSDVFQDRVFVFTPRGDVIDLPIGSTPIDFAYSVHTEVGHRCRGAKVNGKMVPLSYRLKTGDQVSIITTKQGGPSRDWLNPNLGLVNTQRARSKIRAWFKWQDREQNLTQGKEIVKKDLQRLGLSDIDMNEIAKELDFKNTDDLYVAVGCGDLSSMRVVNKINEGLKVSPLQILQPRPIPTDKTKSSGITVIGTGSIYTTFAKCCNPAPGDDIVGYITKGRGATIHKADCPNIIRVKNRERLINVSWGTPEQRYPVTVTVRAYDRQGLINDITNLLVSEDVNLENINVKVAHNYANIQIVLDVLNIVQLSRVLTLIEGLPNVVEAYRNKPG